MVRKIVQGSTLLYASPGPGLEKSFCPNSGGGQLTLYLITVSRR